MSRLMHGFRLPERTNRAAHDDHPIHTRLKQALDAGNLKLHYQPQVGVESGEIVGAEALLRWHDPALGEVSPTVFIPIAESSGLILPLAEWVLDTACEQIARWSEGGTPLRVAINVSPRQFCTGNFPDLVCAALKRRGAQADLLDLEITESVAMTRTGFARDQLHTLLAMGCRVALDDFGTGYSSLSCLKELPVSKLKIDKSFIDGIAERSRDATFCRAIIELAHTLGMTLVAEGVECPEQLAFLRDNSCELFQGWLFSKALSADALSAMLNPRA